MAYLSFTPWPTENGVGVQPAITAAEASAFTAVELRVIALAERVDATSELSHQSRLGRFLERVFGVKLGRPLANPRLESLRRFASLARHHPEELREADMQEFVRAGFSPGQASGLATYFSPSRSHRPNVGNV
jgi:hypothetical protein